MLANNHGMCEGKPLPGPFTDYIFAKYPLILHSHT